MNTEDLGARVRAIIIEHRNRFSRPAVELTGDIRLVESLQLDSLDRIEVVMALEEAFDLELEDDAVAGLVTLDDLIGHLVAKLSAEDDGDCPCLVCKIPMREGDRYFFDESGEFIHADCLGPEREGYTLNGEPLGPDDPIPEPSIWSEDPLSAVAA